MPRKTLRVAAVGDVHYYKGHNADYFRGVAKKADVLLIAGDLTTTGAVEETFPLVQDLRLNAIHQGVPVIVVLGNHDYGEGQEKLIVDHLKANDITVLGRESGDDHVMLTTRGTRFGVAGCKGYMGGFGKDRGVKFGEPLTVALAEEAEREAEFLEKGLYRIRAHRPDVSIALMHYSPIKGTVANESVGIWAWLGTSKLLHACRRGDATIAFHGHAHRGPVIGRSENFPVRNVAYELVHPWHDMTWVEGAGWQDNIRAARDQR